MKIALVTTRFPCLSETFVLSHITGLSARGHGVAVFAKQIGAATPLHEDAVALRLQTHYFSSSPQGRRRRGQGALRLLAGILRLPFRTFTRSLTVSRGAGMASRRHLLAEVGNVAARAPYDCFLCHFGDAGTRAVLLRDVTSPAAPVVTMFHGEDVRAGIQCGDDRYRLLKQRGNCFLAICRVNREQLLRMGFPPERVLDLPVGVSLRRFAPLPASLGSVRTACAGPPTRCSTTGCAASWRAARTWCSPRAHALRRWSSCST